MTLATHAIIGLGLSTLVPAHPAAAFAVSLAGHYLSDSIPHWDYSPPFIIRDATDKFNTRFSGGKKLVVSLAMIGGEFAVGIAVGLWLFAGLLGSPTIIMASVIGSVLPDLLQPMYYIFRSEPWHAIIRFHHFWHGDKKIKSAWWGILSQAALVIALAFIVELLH